MGPRRKPTVTVLLKAHVVSHYILNIYVYAHRFVLLSTLVREACLFCFLQQIVVNVENDSLKYQALSNWRCSAVGLYPPFTAHSSQNSQVWKEEFKAGSKRGEKVKC